MSRFPYSTSHAHRRAATSSRGRFRLAIMTSVSGTEFWRAQGERDVREASPMESAAASPAEQMAGGSSDGSASVVLGRWCVRVMLHGGGVCAEKSHAFTGELWCARPFLCIGRAG